MKQKTKDSLKKNLANFFGAFGYLYCLLQWFWAVMLYFSVIQSTTKFVSPDAATRHIERSSDISFAVPDPLKWAILIAIVVIMAVVTVYALIKMPMSIVKSSNKAVHTTAKAMAPVVIKMQHQKETVKNRRRIASGLVLVIKLLLIAVPISLAVGSGLLDKQYVDYSIATGVGYTLAALSLGSFALQYLLAKLFRVKVADIW